MACKADWYIPLEAGVFCSYAANDTNSMKAYFCTYLTQERTGALAVPSGAQCNRIFKPVRNAFFEGREDARPSGNATVRPDLIDIHLDTLRLWADSASSTRAPRIIYINVINSSPADDRRDFVAVRPRQRAQLPRPRTADDTARLTVAPLRSTYVPGHSHTPR